MLFWESSLVTGRVFVSFQQSAVDTWMTLLFGMSLEVWPLVHILSNKKYIFMKAKKLKFLPIFYHFPEVLKLGNRLLLQTRAFSWELLSLVQSVIHKRIWKLSNLQLRNFVVKNAASPNSKKLRPSLIFHVS